MASDFQIPEDIANRALQHIGAERIVAFSDPSKAAAETSFCYNKLRQSELRRNVWRFSIKRAILRPIDSNTRLWTPPTYNPATTYQMGDVVSYTDTYGRQNLWMSRLVNNVGVAPGTTSGSYKAWGYYTSSIYAYFYDNTQDYYPGDLVYEQTAFATFNIFSCKVATSTDDPGEVLSDVWDPTITYQLNDLVSVGSQNYISLSMANLNQNPTTATTYWATTSSFGSYQWKAQAGTLQEVPIMWPLGTGPADQTFTKNAYPLPTNYLGDAPQDPTTGATSLLGSPTNLGMNDWEIEGNFIVSEFSEPLFFRFKADVQDVTEMDALFCEGLACRIGIEVCEPITQASDKLGHVTQQYVKFMGEARAINAIEIGPVEPPIDDYISTRL